ncbi:techylectin-5B-like isoform X2 [Saccostrea echinata]|uniref:techylectin-5B-like isoform X2 n=1 Tax=Saccostrea echinata TaxID=191078 RepID=UPI002A7EBE76|nr:techylectin-5B-like isoform X2 [Saccostrea echinata]
MDSSKERPDSGYITCSAETIIKAQEHQKYDDGNPCNVYVELNSSHYDKISDSAVIFETTKSDNEYVTPAEIQDPGYSKINEIPVHVVRPLQNERPNKKNTYMYKPETVKSFHQSEAKPPLPKRNPLKSKRSKRPFLIGCLFFFLIIIISSLVTVVVLYINKKDTPEANANTQISSTDAKKNTSMPTTRTSKTTISTITVPITMTTKPSKMTTTTSASDISTVDKHKDCKEIYQQGYTTSGVYTIYPYLPVTRRVEVYCDMTTDGGGWTVFQHRKDGSVDFYLDWVDYKSGFGESKGEHWLGNEHLHQLTMLGSSDFYVRLEKFSGGWFYARYNDFVISNETDGYRMRLRNGSYQGNAGESIESHGTTNTNGQKFSTRDIDNDFAEGSCAIARKGAWWHNICTWANLNGIYGNGSCQTAGNCNFWYSLTNNFGGVKTSFMMVRRV